MTRRSTRWTGRLLSAVFAAAAVALLALGGEKSSAVGTPISNAEMGQLYGAAGTPDYMCIDRSHCNLDPCYSPMHAGQTCTMCTSQMIQAICQSTGSWFLNCRNVALNCGTKVVGVCGSSSPWNCVNGIPTDPPECSGSTCIMDC